MQKTTKATKAVKSFTLVEVFIALSLIGLIGSVIATQSIRFIQKARLESDLSALCITLNRISDLSLFEQRHYKITLKKDNSGLMLLEEKNKIKKSFKSLALQGKDQIIDIYPQESLALQKIALEHSQEVYMICWHDQKGFFLKKSRHI